MRMRTKYAWFAAFTVLYAVLVAFVFWGTWSLSVAPVMPDCPITHPLDYTARLTRWAARWLETGKFVPGDLTVFVGSPYFWQELQYAVAAYFAALGMVYFLRGRGLSRLAAYGGGLLLAFSGYWFSLFSAGHLGWFQWMTYGVFAFGLADRAVRKGRARHWLLLGACLAWGSFYQPDLWLLFSVLTGVYFVWCCIRERRLPGWKGMGLALAAFVLIGAVSFRSALTGDLAGRDRQIAESKGTAMGGGAAKSDDEARWIFTTNWSMPPEDTKEFFIPRIQGDTSCPMTLSFGRRAGRDVRPYEGRLGRPLGAPSGNYRQHSLYVGWVTCLLALLGVVFIGFRRPSMTEDRPFLRSDAAFFAVAAIVFWLFSMGRYCESVYHLVYALPFGDYLRAPVKWHHLTEFCLVVLAAYGIDRLGRMDALRGRVAQMALAALVVFGAADLARIDRLYCAPIDISLVRAKNPAADEILRLGKGRVLDCVEGGNGLVAWSFTERGIPLTGDAADADIRYLWASLGQLKTDRALGEWVKTHRARPVGTYRLTQEGIRSAAMNESNMALFIVDSGRVVTEGEPLPKPQPLTVALGILSLVGTLSVAGICLLLVRRRM